MPDMALTGSTRQELDSPAVEKLMKVSARKAFEAFFRADENPDRRIAEYVLSIESCGA